MPHIANIKARSDGELFNRFYGFEYGPDNAILAVMERHDGKAEMIGMDTLHLIQRNYSESSRQGLATPYRLSLLASENALASDVAGLMNDLRTESFPPRKPASSPAQEFIIASPAFPPAIVEEAKSLTRKFTRKPLAQTLKTGPVRS